MYFLTFSLVIYYPGAICIFFPQMFNTFLARTTSLEYTQLLISQFLEKRELSVLKGQDEL